jgi:hypothetical protein
MKYVLETGLGVLIYISHFITIGPCVEEFIEGMHIEKHKQQSDLIILIVIISYY